jgi:hypothetical protein
VNNILFKPKPTVYGGSIKFSRDYLIEGLGGRSSLALLVRQLITALSDRDLRKKVVESDKLSLEQNGN